MDSNRFAKLLQKATEKSEIKPEDQNTFQEGEPRNMLADFVNPHLPDMLQIPKVSVADRKEFMNENLDPASLGMAVSPGVIKNISNIAKKVDPKLFHDIIENVRNDSNDIYRHNISKYSPEEYEQFKTFLTPDNKSGFAVKPDGELISVFSKEKGRGADLVDEAVKQGASKLNAYDIGGKLPSVYGRYMDEVERQKFNPEYAIDNFNYDKYGTPDYIDMKLNPLKKMVEQTKNVAKEIPPGGVSTDQDERFRKIKEFFGLK